MRNVAIKDTRAQPHHSPIVKTASRQTFEERLVEEANAGRMILATGAHNTPLPVKPQETTDFWDIYNETRADRF